MTRAERLAKAAATTREKIAVEKRQLASIASKQRDAARKARDRRRSQLGALVENAGLGGLDDATLAGLFAVLAPLATVPHPVAVLESLLRDVGGLRACVEGCAQAAPGVPPTVSV